MFQPAFQRDAFQDLGFQLDDSTGFQADAFQRNAFQLSHPKPRFGGYSETKKRKKNIVNIDGTLYVFNSAREAVNFLNQHESTTKVIDETPEQIKPVREIRLSQVETLAKVFTMPEAQKDIYQSIQLHNYADVIRAYDRFIEQDDEEALLLLM